MILIDILTGIIGIELLIISILLIWEKVTKMSDPKIVKNDIVNITVKVSANQNVIYENAQFISMANPDGSGMWKFIADNKLVYAYPHIVEKP